MTQEQLNALKAAAYDASEACENADAAFQAVARAYQVQRTTLLQAKKDADKAVHDAEGA